MDDTSKEKAFQEPSWSGQAMQNIAKNGVGLNAPANQNHFPQADSSSTNNFLRSDPVGAINSTNVSANTAASPKNTALDQPKASVRVIDAINANGILSGRKIVDAIWQRIAFAALVVGAGLFIALLIAVAFSVISSKMRYEADVKYEASNTTLSHIYQALGAKDENEAMHALSNMPILLSGDDMRQIMLLVRGKYGANATVDFNAGNSNFVQRLNGFRIASFDVLLSKPVASNTDKAQQGNKQPLPSSPSTKPQETKRAVLYARIGEGKWTLSQYNPENYAHPCAKLSDEEKAILERAVSCQEIVTGKENSINTEPKDKAPKDESQK